MTPHSPFVWKVVYGVSIAVLLYPLYVVGQPSSYSDTGQRSGGVLAQLRSEHGLSQAELGEIDPASESMKLATLGMRGVAANLLWDKANDYKRTEDWDNLSATLNQITKLQPNFISVWEFQAHNLSYNVSVEFDNFRHRYHWVKKGMDFLVEGTQYNRNEPRLLHTIGWYTGHKLGRSDEHVQFRRMFRVDTDYHKAVAPHIPGISGPEVLGPERLYPDNWLVSRLWYEKAQTVVNSGVPIRGKSPLLFHADKAMARINYAAAIEDEGTFGRPAQIAWRTAGEDWREYGNLQLPTSWGTIIRLNDEERERDRARQLRRDLDELAKSRDAVALKKKQSLTDAERQLIDTPEQDMESWTPEQWQAFVGANAKLEFTHMEVADAAPADVRSQARKLAKKLLDAETLIDRIVRYRNIVNFRYWRTRCEVEQTETATQARQMVYDANQLLDKAEIEDARETYEQAWDKWHEVFEQYPSLKEDITADELRDSIRRYLMVLRQLGDELPEDFKLMWLLTEEEVPERIRRLMESRGLRPDEAAESDESEPKAPAEDTPPKTDAEADAEAGQPPGESGEAGTPAADPAEAEKNKAPEEPADNEPAEES